MKHLIEMNMSKNFPTMVFFNLDGTHRNEEKHRETCLRNKHKRKNRNKRTR